MPNGKPGDHPYTDIVVHGLDVFGEEIDSTVRRLDGSLDEGGRDRLAELLWNSDLWWGNVRGSLASKRTELLAELKALEADRDSG